MGIGWVRARKEFAGVGAAAGGGTVAWALAAAGYPGAGAAFGLAGIAGGAFLASRKQSEALGINGLWELLRTTRERPDHPLASVSAELGGLLERVENSGKSIRDVVRHLQEHATLVAWVIDTLNDTVSGARKSLGSMQGAMHRVRDHAGEVLRASIQGADLIQDMGGRTEELFQSTDTLNQSVEEATSSVFQIHGALSSVQQGVALLSEASDRTTQFISQVGAAMGAIRQNTDESLAVAQKVDDHARRGREIVGRVGRGVEQIRRSSEGMVESVQALAKQSREIEGILGIITDVAEETGLLSLNAAILAAQAGERGAAFAVVADQIRSLAYRTRESTKHIAELIGGIQTNIAEANRSLERNLEAVDDGEKMGQEAVRQLELIERAVGDSVDQVRRISQAAQDQDEKSRTMVDAAGEVNSNLHQVAENLGQSINEMDRIQALVQSLAALSQFVRGAAEEHRQTGWKTKELMGSLSAQVEGIHALVDGQTETSVNLDQSLCQVSESSDSTRESLETIHKIVNDLVGHSDLLQEEVHSLMGNRPEETGEHD